MALRPTRWDEETLFPSGDEYFTGLLTAIENAQSSVELETYIFEKGVLAERFKNQLVTTAKRGIRTRLIVDGLGSPSFFSDFYPELKAAGVRVRFFRVFPWLLNRLPGDPNSFFRRVLWRWTNMNRGNHRKFCLIDQRELWVGSYNISDVHLRSVCGEAAWKDLGVRVTGPELKYARRAFQRAFLGWAALNFPARSPRLLLLNDSYIHKRRRRLEQVKKIREAKHRIWIATPYFVPIGTVYRRLIRQARQGLDVRLMVPQENDVWLMRWMIPPLLNHLQKKGVKVFIYKPRFMHQKLLIVDDWICVGSTNLNHRSFLHDLEMDVVVTHDENKKFLLDDYLNDLKMSDSFDSSDWAHLPWWQRWLSAIFLLLKYWS